ncbi:DUF3598 family protein [Pseudanabaena biceps]|nr:DUF3598 family protein [Pseudanabaena biceps]
MRSQWECLLENLGCWRGSFTRLSITGEMLEDIPSETSFELKEDNCTMRQVVRRFYDDQPQDLVLEYRTLNKSTTFFENGAFSQGSLQFAPHAEFGAEMGLIYGDRRLRIIPIYDPLGAFSRLTVIRESRNDSLPKILPSPILQPQELLGKWQGEAIKIDADWLEPEVLPSMTEWKQDGDRLIMTEQIGNQQITNITNPDAINSQILKFKQDDLVMQTLFLPDRATITCPIAIAPRQPIRLSISWLLEPNVNQKMIRTYDVKGAWTSLILVTERKAL